MEWSNKFNVGIKIIDQQHQKLIEMLNILHEAMKSGKGNEKLEEILKQLTNYVVNHFSTEEKLMQEHEYTESVTHKSEHEAFINKVQEFKESYIPGKTTLTIEIMNYLSNWLVKHILGTDKKLGIYLNKQGIN